MFRKDGSKTVQPGDLIGNSRTPGGAIMCFGIVCTAPKKTRGPTYSVKVLWADTGVCDEMFTTKPNNPGNPLGNSKQPWYRVYG